ncbi:indole-3-acetaldehyde oxidase-like [Heracleum sosnowskyi]|uniref:Indole-3-acetaldehyde oxidase-like n=1 Tax=Heracleum sosnowskyi TaxID=360622 RepID=A0AAD8J0F2_9APIA|nr:indole-3-acetaldehyde oxidase-like [Heracleum sosnowskyi]
MEERVQKKKQKLEFGPDPPTGFSKLTVDEAEKSISGHFCRCTGYRPIADACKSFASDVHMEDLGINSFWKKGESDEAKMSKLPFYNPKDDICTYPEFLKRELESTMCLNINGKSWHSPLTLKELESSIETDMATDSTQSRLVAGDTGRGYYKELDHYDNYIDLKKVSELLSIKRDHTGIIIGAAVTISQAILALNEEREGVSSFEGELIYKKIVSHLKKVATESVRNSASIGGNLVMAHRSSFPSDIVTILVAVGSKVNLMTDLRHENLILEEFLSRPSLDQRSVLVSIHVPCWGSLRYSFSKETEPETRLLFETYRAASRPLGNALPYLNAAFLAVVSSIDDGVVINEIQMAFGAFGTKHAKRARTVEKYFAGKILSSGVLYEAVQLIRADVVPEEGTSDALYRSSLAVSYLFEFLYPIVKTGNIVTKSWLNENTKLFYKNGNRKEKGSQYDSIRKPTLLSSGKQVIQSSTEYYPIGEPITKSGACIQASGEAVYVDDIPSPTNCLYGAFIYSTKPLARVKNIRFISNLLPLGVSSLITCNDIPQGGQNISSQSVLGSETLFADDLTECPGQRVALVDCGTANYDTENLEPPIMTVEEAVENSSFFDILPFLRPAQVGNFSKGMAEADQSILSAEIRLPSQYYFYMKSQTALAIPDEDGCMVVHSSSQCPESAHKVIAVCLGIPENNVRVITRRVEGGFGGKAGKSMPVSFFPDASAIIPGNMIGVLKKYDWGALSFDIKLCKTNHSSKSTMRRGELVDYTLPSIWDRLAISSSFEQRIEMIKLFNQNDKWRKRGLSRVPIVIPVTLRPSPGKVSILSDGSICVEVGGIELGEGLWTKKENK